MSQECFCFLFILCYTLYMSAREHLEPEPRRPVEIDAQSLEKLNEEAGRLVHIGSRLLALSSRGTNGDVTADDFRKAMGEINVLPQITETLIEEVKKLAGQVPELRDTELPKLPSILPDEDQG